MISLPRMGRKLRIGIWLLLIMLTMAIFLFPVHLKFGYQLIQSLDIFENLPLFGALYFVWILSLLWLLLSPSNGAKDDWQRLALIGIFAIVFLGFWAVITPGGFITDYQPGGLGYVRYLQEEGGISSATPRNFGYFQFPVTSLLGHAVSQVTGLDIPHARTLLLLFFSLLLATSLYVFFKNSLKSTTLASVAALLAIQGNLLLARSLRFYPAGLGIILFVVFLLLLSRRQKAIFETTQDKVIAVILMLAITATHYITSFYVLAILVGIYIVQKLSKSSLMKPLLIIPLLVIPLAWGLSWANPMFNLMIGTSSEVAQIAVAPIPAGEVAPGEVAPSEIPPALSLWWVGSMAAAYLGAQVPLWARVTIAFWVFLIFVFGAILVLRNLFMVRKLSIADKKVTGAMLGIIVLTGLAVFTSLPIGGYQFFRLLQFSAFFTIPIMLSFLWSLPHYRRRQIFISLILVLLFLLSFPTFLAHNNTIGVDAIYSQETSAGRFLESVYGRGEKLIVFGVGTQAYLPDATFRSEPELNYPINYPKRELCLRGIDKLVADFENPVDDTKEYRKIFVLSPRKMWWYYHIFEIEPTHPKWGEIRNRLSGTNLIYNDGFNEVYER